jgi:hypothetical protein
VLRTVTLQHQTTLPHQILLHPHLQPNVGEGDVVLVDRLQTPEVKKETLSPKSLTRKKPEEDDLNQDIAVDRLVLHPPAHQLIQEAAVF